MVYYLFVTVNQLSYIAVFQMSGFFAILNRIASVIQLENFKQRPGLTQEQNQSNKPSQDIKEPTDKNGGYIKVENASYNWGFRLAEKLSSKESKEQTKQP